MKNKIILCAGMFVLLLAILGAQLMTVSASPHGIWLYYDDGGSEVYATLWNQDDTIMIAVLFTDIPTCDLLRVQYYIRADPNYDFRLHIMDSYWNDIHTETCTPSQTGWFEVDLSEEAIVVSGQFYVGMECYNNINLDGMFRYVPTIGMDTDDPDVGHSWLWWGYPHSTDIELVESQDYMIRAEIEPLPPELYYDDGTSESGSSYMAADLAYGDCVMFHHPQPGEPYRIVSAKIYIHSDGGYPLRLFVYVYNPSAPDPNKPYQKVYESVTSVLTVGWNIIALPSISTTQDFLIGVNWVVAYNPRLGNDYNTQCHSWRFYTSSWTEISYHRDHNHMIRAVVAKSVVGGVWVPVDKLGLLAPYIGVASTIVIVTVATAIYVKRAKPRKEKQ